jgi:transcription elongation factor GreA
MKTLTTGIFGQNDPVAETAANAKLDPQVRLLFESNKSADVEELFLTRTDSTPGDLSFFIPVLRHYVRNKNTGTAEMLLEFLMEATAKETAPERWLSLIRAVLTVWPESKQARKLAIDNIASSYARCQNLQKLLDHFKVRETPDPLAAFRKLESWLRFDIGQGVYLATKGVGRVSEVNPSLNAIRVVFAGSPIPVSFKPDEAERLLEPLFNGHLLLDVLDRPDEIRALAAADSGELLRRLFTSMKRELSVSEVKDLLSSIVSVERWSAWWAQAKKDRRCTVSKSNICTWNDSADDADAVLVKEFAAATPREKLEMAKNFAKRSPSLASTMVASLAETARELTSTDPSFSLEVYLSFDKLPGGAGIDIDKPLATLLKEAGSPALLSRIEDRTIRKKAIALAKDLRRDWHTFYFTLIRSETDSSTITFLYEALTSGDHAGSLEDLIIETVSSPVKAPDFFIWLCKSMTERPELERFRTWSLVPTILSLLAKDTIKHHNASLRKMFDQGGLVDTIARKLDKEATTQFLTLLDRDSSLEDYRKDRLRKELHALFSPAHKDENKLFYVTAGSLAQRQAEFMKITTIDIPHNTEEIVKARAHGDLRENFEYHAARTRQELLSSRAKTLHDELQFARPIDPSKVDPATICIGTTSVLVPEAGGEKAVITILGPWDSDPENDIFSYLARVAEGLLGKKAGDVVSFNEKPCLVDSIMVWQLQ